MRYIYDILEHSEKRPAMFLGNDFDINSLNTFILGFWMGGGKFYDKAGIHPNFSLFTGWIGGLFKYKYEKSSGNWSWFLTEKYADKKTALTRFFHYLAMFKEEAIEVSVLPVTQEQIAYSIKHQHTYLCCGNHKAYDRNLRKLDRIILFKVGKSRTWFCIMVDKKDRILDERNIDMTGKILQEKIKKQFNMKTILFDKKQAKKGREILQLNRII